MKSGLLKDLGDFELLLPGIGPDKISDLAINVIRGELAAYTLEQCELHGVPTENVAAGFFWNPEHERWESHYAQLPVYNGEKIILVPKVGVRRHLLPDANEYYTYYVLPFLAAEHLDAKDALVHTLKNGNPKVYKADLRAKYRLTKDMLFEFSQRNPNILEGYKRDLAKKAETPVANQAIEDRQAVSRQINAKATVEDLKHSLRGPGCKPLS